MGEPFVLPDDVTSALLQIKNDGAAATLTKEQLRALDAKAAGQGWPAAIAPTDHSHSHYVFRGEQIRVSWKWELDLGRLRRDPLPVFMAANPPPEQPGSMGLAGQLLRDSPKRIFYDALWFPLRPEDSKVVLAWIEEWAGLALQRRHVAFDDYSEAVHQALQGMALIVERLQEGTELTIKDWLWMGRAWERLEIETKSELSSHSPTAVLRAYTKDRAANRKGRATTAKHERDAFDDDLTTIAPIAARHLCQSPKLSRASLAKKVLDDWPRKTRLGLKAIENRLDALKAKGTIVFPDPKPRGRNAKKMQGGAD
jgi:hypothetical protein